MNTKPPRRSLRSILKELAGIGIGSDDALICLQDQVIVAYLGLDATTAVAILGANWVQQDFSQWIITNREPDSLTWFLEPRISRAYDAIVSRNLNLLRNGILEAIPNHEAAEDLWNRCLAVAELERKLDAMPEDQLDEHLDAMEEPLDEPEDDFWELISSLVGAWEKELRNKYGPFEPFVTKFSLQDMQTHLLPTSMARDADPSHVNLGQLSRMDAFPGGIQSSTVAVESPTLERTDAEFDDWTIDHMVALGVLIAPFGTKKKLEWQDVCNKLRRKIGKSPYHQDSDFVRRVWREANIGKRLSRGAPYGQGPNEASKVETWYFNEIQGLADIAAVIVKKVRAMPEFQALKPPPQGRRTQQKAKDATK
jgi:hypothetical protein